MTRFQRIRTFLSGILMFVLGVFFIIDPEDGYENVVFILSLWLVIAGIHSIYFFFTMARHMVGGMRSLVAGIFILDLGLFTITLSDVPRIYLLLYLLSMNTFSGLVELLSAVDAMRLKSPHFRLKLAQGLFNIFLGLACLLFLRYANTAVYIYSLGLLINAVLRIISSFRKTAMIYIQ